jgi:hypothetical protein
MGAIFATGSYRRPVDTHLKPDRYAVAPAHTSPEPNAPDDTVHARPEGNTITPPSHTLPMPSVDSVGSSPEDSTATQ